MYDLLSIMNLEVAVSKSMSRHVDRQCEKVKKGNDAYQLKKCMKLSFSTKPACAKNKSFLASLCQPCRHEKRWLNDVIADRRV